MLPDFPGHTILRARQAGSYQPPKPTRQSHFPCSLPFSYPYSSPCDSQLLLSSHDISLTALCNPMYPRVSLLFCRSSEAKGWRSQFDVAGPRHQRIANARRWPRPPRSSGLGIWGFLNEWELVTGKAWNVVPSKPAYGYSRIYLKAFQATYMKRLTGSYGVLLREWLPPLENDPWLSQGLRFKVFGFRALCLLCCMLLRCYVALPTRRRPI